MYSVYAIGVNYCIDKDTLGNACMRGGTHTVKLRLELDTTFLFFTTSFIQKQVFFHFFSNPFSRLLETKFSIEIVLFLGRLLNLILSG